MGSTTVSHVLRFLNVPTDNQFSSLLMRISVQTAAPQQLYPEVSARHNIEPERHPTIKSAEKTVLHHKVPTKVSTISLYEKKLLARLPKCLETAGMLLYHRYDFKLGAIQLGFRSGLTITRRWSKIGQDIYAAEGRAISMSFQSSRLIHGRLTFVLFLLYHTLYTPRLSLRFNLELTSLVPLNNPGFKAVQAGDIVHLRQMITSESLAVSTTTSGGYTLLHVCINVPMY